VTTHDMPPVLAPWLKSRSEFTGTLYGAVRRTGHRCSYHGARVPLYALRLALLAPRGLWRTRRALFNLVFDGQSRPLRAHHVDRLESREYVQLSKLHTRVRLEGGRLLPGPSSDTSPKTSS